MPVRNRSKIRRKARAIQHRPETLAKALRARKLRKTMSVAKIARKLGVTNQSIYLYLRA